MQQRTAKEAQAAALTEMKAKQIKFSEKVTQSFGDELEEHIRTFSDDPQFIGMLDEYDGVSVLSTNVLEIVMAPIIQLAEIKGLGAAVIFAERIITLKQDKNFISLFTHQISKLSPDVDLIRGYNAANLQISLANLMTVFTFEYSLYKIHSGINTNKFLKPEAEKKLQQDMADLAVAYVFKILRYLEEVAKSKNLNLAQLKREFLAEEERAPVAMRWRKVMEDRRQEMKDAELARGYVRETLHVIEQNIQAALSAKEIDEIQLEKILNQGIRMITNPDYAEIIHAENNRYSRHARFLDGNERFPFRLTPRMEAQLKRYIQIRKGDIDLFNCLSRAGCVITLDQVISLNVSSKEFLFPSMIQNNNAFRAMVANCSPDMLNHINKIYQLTGVMPTLDIRKLRNWPRDKLQECLDRLLQNAYIVNKTFSILKLNINDLLIWPPRPIDNKFIEFLIDGKLHENPGDIDANFVQDVLRPKITTKITPNILKFIAESDAGIPIIMIIAMLPGDLGDQYLQGKMTIAGIHAINIFAKRFSSTDAKLIACILRNPYFIESFRKHDSCDQEIKLILDRKMSVDQVETIYSEDGMACVTNGYCEVEQQFDLPLEFLPFIQKILLDLKKRPEPQFLQALANPSLMAAYEARFIDIFFIESASMEGLNTVARHWRDARSAYISDAWDPKFQSFVKSKQSAFKSQNMWANSAKRDKKSKQSSHGPSFRG